ncbi:hypothetical protein GF402_11280 [Candidatus Fermentibacteria bacterium]|nr:hypothetical protein [Candidatus Fermentibacteria bacterium]
MACLIVLLVSIVSIQPQPYHSYSIDDVTYYLSETEIHAARLYGWLLPDTHPTCVAPPAHLARDVDFWIPLQGPFGGWAYSIEVDPTDDEVAYAGMKRGLFKTVDAGESWFSVDETLDSLNLYNTMELYSI